MPVRVALTGQELIDSACHVIERISNPSFSFKDIL
jgi:hypothetical protein